MKLRCAIFDFDGTLYDSMYLWDDAAPRYLRSVGAMPRPDVREQVRTMSQRQSAEYFHREYLPALSVDAIETGINKTVEHYYLDEVQPKPGAPEFLAELRRRGITLCLATATDRYMVEAALARCGLAGAFDAIFTCAEVGHGKNEPEIYRRALAFSGADRGSAVIFEDALFAARTAKRDGFIVAAVQDDHEPQPAALAALCDVCIPDFYHLEDFWAFASAE